MAYSADAQIALDAAESSAASAQTAGNAAEASVDGALDAANYAQIAADEAAGFATVSATALAPGLEPTATRSGSVPNRNLNIGIPGAEVNDGNINPVLANSGSNSHATIQGIAAAQVNDETVNPVLTNPGSASRATIQGIALVQSLIFGG